MTRVNTVRIDGRDVPALTVRWIPAYKYTVARQLGAGAREAQFTRDTADTHAAPPSGHRASLSGDLMAEPLRVFCGDPVNLRYA